MLIVPVPVPYARRSSVENKRLQLHIQPVLWRCLEGLCFATLASPLVWMQEQGAL